MRQFGIALGCLFLLVMTYAWQHFRAIEYGYKIETLKMQRDGLLEDESRFCGWKRLRCAIRSELTCWRGNLDCSLRRPDR